MSTHQPVSRRAQGCRHLGLEQWIGLAVGGLILLALLRLLVGVVWFRRRAKRITRRLQFTGSLAHRITVPASEDGRPGQTFAAPSLSSYAPNVDDNGDRSACAIGVVRNRRDDAGVPKLARAALDTWEWLPPPRALGA